MRYVVASVVSDTHTHRMTTISLAHALKVNSKWSKVLAHGVVYYQVFKSII